MLSDIENFYTHVEKSGRCLIYKGSTNRNGYAVIGRRVDGEPTALLAHRYAWFLNYGEYPLLELDHLCGNRNCVRVSHLDDVDHSTNISRGGNYNRKKTHCKYGHELSGDNVRHYFSRGYTSRACRTCKRVESKRRYEKKKNIMTSYIETPVKPIKIKPKRGKK